eukprot:gnl/MRDRNA2_/MRDRNA2_84970_c0_seq1.p1 gnl/MRDRNA2_/MRDRNA2_84970_c0~~gnl/MRDRNA2_/MRDRNA2_84970_c0_seq1.p1  ORF type:complete len:328 (+),score=46.25 gnl/MRDRNA2_/MRDRNA2_84970_c0_seq1:81-1064(+)
MGLSADDEEKHAKVNTQRLTGHRRLLLALAGSVTVIGVVVLLSLGLADHGFQLETCKNVETGTDAARDDDHTLQDVVLEQPSSRSLPNLKKWFSSYSQWAQDVTLWPLFANVTDGFFLESGARDGEDHSNTLFFELKGWTGLLVEPNQREFGNLKSKHRKAYAFNGCLSPTGKRAFCKYDNKMWGLGSVSGAATGKVVCEPLAALLKKIMRKTIDFWSLDVEGSEASVLETIDFREIEIGLLLIEMNKDENNNRGIRAVMDEHGFKDIGVTLHHTNFTNLVDVPPNIPLKDFRVLDHVFVNPEYFRIRGLTEPTNIQWLDYRGQYRL